ncbi:hypothetical protein KUTeg_001633 [Tegillarca granosa]|uniref:Copper type II ascorbate-dependent monooxygenase C-terminal domain-containing protein n=1 Tax=Tegillarca granosa TaxID=220873 RepID=A0ABQ9FS07_TEGGR|nr:hypothetical protein KUTeg_001633 [Tegillarca granosa]
MFRILKNRFNCGFTYIRLRKPVEVQPGDELRVTCAYNTYSVNRTVVSGSGPTDEVCSAEVSYYPSENWNNPECENFLSLPLCKIKAVGVINGCQFSRFLSSLPKEPTVDAIITECNQNCNQNCSNLVEIMKRHSCFQGDLLNLWESNLNALKNNRLNIVFWAIRNCENISRNTMPIIPGPV